MLRCTIVNSAIDQFENDDFAKKAVQQAIVPGCSPDLILNSES